MLDKETYKRELSRYFNSIRDDDCKDEVEDPTDCIGISCMDCIFNTEDGRECIYNIKYIFDAFEELEKWSKEHPPKKYNVSQLEYDILKSYLDYKNHMTVDIADYFFEDGLLLSLLKKGHFKGATKEMFIKDYLNDCEVVHE